MVLMGFVKVLIGVITKDIKNREKDSLNQNEGKENKSRWRERDLTRMEGKSIKQDRKEDKTVRMEGA